MDRNHQVVLAHREREVARLLLAGDDPKTIAGLLEISAKTVYRRIDTICAKAKVLDREQLVIWMLQHPSCLFQGVSNTAGLHPQPCGCGSGYCIGHSAALLPPDQAAALLRAA